MGVQTAITLTLLSTLMALPVPAKVITDSYIGMEGLWRCYEGEVSFYYRSYGEDGSAVVCPGFYKAMGYRGEPILHGPEGRYLLGIHFTGQSIPGTFPYVCPGEKLEDCEDYIQFREYMVIVFPEGRATLESTCDISIKDAEELVSDFIPQEDLVKFKGLKAAGLVTHITKTNRGFFIPECDLKVKGLAFVYGVVSFPNPVLGVQPITLPLPGEEAAPKGEVDISPDISPTPTPEREVERVIAIKEIPWVLFVVSFAIFSIFVAIVVPPLRDAILNIYRRLTK